MYLTFLNTHLKELINLHSQSYIKDLTAWRFSWSGRCLGSLSMGSDNSALERFFCLFPHYENNYTLLLMWNDVFLSLGSFGKLRIKVIWIERGNVQILYKLNQKLKCLTQMRYTLRFGTWCKHWPMQGHPWGIIFAHHWLQIIQGQADDLTHL